MDVHRIRTSFSPCANVVARMLLAWSQGRISFKQKDATDMTSPTQNQNQNQNKNPQQNPNQAQGRKDDMHNTGAQAKKNETASKDADRDVQQRKDAPKPDPNH